MRYIPVRTGQILPRLYTLFLPWVHPRAYGADEEKDCYEIIGEGSSPYIRGRFALINPHMSPARFIPVYTGRIITLCAKKSKIWAHPRVYGADRRIHTTSSSVHRLIPVYTGRILNFSKISEATKSPIRSQIPVICSVCIIFSKYVFADNAFWSKSGRNNGLSLPYMFRHNKTTGRISFSQIAIPSCVSDT